MNRKKVIRHHGSADRDYRRSFQPRDGERGFQAAVEQSDLWIVARGDLRDKALQRLHAVRSELKAYMVLHPEFAASLVPVDVPPSVTGLVRDMAEAGRICGVGPMAAVAGGVAQTVADHLVSDSPDVLVENGGDLFLHSTRERKVALLAEPESGASLGLRLEAASFPLSICSSSANIGHSLSLGAGDLVTVIADTGVLADAAATALCNVLRSARDLDKVLALARQWTAHGLRGVFAQGGGRIAAWGDVELVAL
ncbi:MAG: UPF0280 family protein [Desulfovibrionaceae bacterium]